MSVILKDMEMPDECMNCEFGVYGFNFSHCELKDHGRIISQKCIDNGTRPDWCPLVEIPEGARLIDGNKISSDMDDMKVEGETFVTAVNFVKLIVNDAPVIFEED